MDSYNSPLMHPISVIAERLGIPDDLLEPYGRHTAKIRLEVLERFPARRGKLVLITAITPTTSGEGKTVTTIGLTQGLVKRGHNAVAALREPSLGPLFGQKGGATGGGKASLAPLDKINLHFTGDFHAITAAHNLLAALLDTHLHFGNELGIDPKEILWPRAIDMNDRVVTSDRHRPGRPRQRARARDRVRDHGGVGDHGDPRARREPQRPPPAPRRHRRRLQLRGNAGARGGPEGGRPDDGAAQRRAAPQSGADDGGRACHRALRPVWQHRARHEQRPGPAHWPASVGLRDQRDRVCRRSGRREVLRSGDADVRARAVGGCCHRDAEGASRPGRVARRICASGLPEPEAPSRELETLGRARRRRAQPISR